MHYLILYAFFLYKVPFNKVFTNIIIIFIYIAYIILFYFPFYLSFIDLIILLGIINYTLILLLNIYLVFFKNTLILINNESDFYLFLSPFNNFVKFHNEYLIYKILIKI